MNEEIKEKRFKEIKEFLKGIPSNTVALYGIGNFTKNILESLNDEERNKIYCLLDKDVNEGIKFNYRIMNIDNILDSVKYIIICSDVYQYIIYDRIKKYKDKFEIKMIFQLKDFGIFGSQLSYEETKELWEMEDIKVHNSEEMNYFNEFFKEIQSIMKLSNKERVLDVGCGDGKIDYFIKNVCKELNGFDFSETKLEKARDLNPNCIYWNQSFLSPYKANNYDVVFSYGVLQYCKKNDVEKFLLNALDSLNDNGILYIFNVPVKEKLHIGFKKFFENIPFDIIEEHKDEINELFHDGSNWHEESHIKVICNKYNLNLKILNDLGIEGQYRSHFIICK